MKTLLAACLFMLTSALYGSAVYAQQPTSDSASNQAPVADVRQQMLLRGSKIIGRNVHDQRDKRIGQIKDLILDKGRGEVAYVVVSFGGVMGVGRKLHAIPWQALQPSEDGRYYVLHADRETITQAPGFDKQKWPDMTDRRWSEEIDRYWSRMVGRGPAGHSLSPGTFDATDAGKSSAPSGDTGNAPGTR